RVVTAAPQREDQDAPQRVVILGAGTGGTMVANRLAKRFKHAARGASRDRASDGVTITVVGDGQGHVFQPANLDVAFKGTPANRSIRKERPLLPKSVVFEPAGAVRADTARRVVALNDGRELPYDALVIATGAVADPTLMPGLAKQSLNFHTGPFEAARIWQALGAMGEGKIVVAIAGVPYKCPPSPVEAVFLLDDHSRHRGVRDAVDIRLVTPYPRAYPAPEIAEVVEPRLKERGIDLTTLFNMDSVDPAKRVITSLEGEEVPYDLLIAVPPHRGAEVITASGLGDADGFVATDKETMRVVGHDDVFALGDATAIPISKSGVVAHLEAEVVAENVARSLTGEPGMLAFDGRINCPMEVGGHRALFVSATYLKGAARQNPNIVRYAMKKSFGRMYWGVVKGEYEWLMAPYFGKTNHEQEVAP
ncbi:MAG: NAD(P)/FAD-dependent oxidoreductase, partial [Thermoplasmatota archaeon]